MIDTKKETFPEGLNLPGVLKECILEINVEPILKEISLTHKLNEDEEIVYTQLCRDYLFSFPKHTHGFIRNLETKDSITGKKAKTLAKAFKERILEQIVESIKTYGINLSKDYENILFEYEKLKISDKYIYYSAYEQPQPINMVSNIKIHKNFLSSKHTIIFEVFIPEKGRWGTVDRPGFVFSKEKAIDCADKLEKAIIWGAFRLMYENIEHYY